MNLFLYFALWLSVVLIVDRDCIAADSFYVFVEIRMILTWIATSAQLELTL